MVINLIYEPFRSSSKFCLFHRRPIFTSRLKFLSNKTVTEVLAGTRLLQSPIQCKNWNKSKVSVQVVCELLGVVTKEKAARGVVINSGMFTKDAKKYAADVSIDLVE